MTSLKNRQLLINVLLGIGLISVPFLSSPDLQSGIKILTVTPFQRSLASYFLLLVFFYLNYYYIIPFYYIKKRWLPLSVILIGCYLLIYFLPNYLLKDSMVPPFRDNTRSMPPKLGFPMVLFSRDSYLFQFIILFILSLHLRISNHLREVKSEQLKTEILYLKAQINPHFLFNTLNSIYALALKKAEKTPMAVLKLSNIMRYVVTESDQKRVALQNEVDYINDYIDLQRLRLTNDVSIEFNITGEMQHVSIAPMIFINFIENAFKYGISQESESKITIQLNVETNKTIKFIVENRVFDFEYTDIESTKEGLKNTRKRLEYIYPNSHHLEIIETPTTYQVHLEINLE